MAKNKLRNLGLVGATLLALNSTPTLADYKVDLGLDNNAQTKVYTMALPAGTDLDAINRAPEEVRRSIGNGDSHVTLSEYQSDVKPLLEAKKGNNAVLCEENGSNGNLVKTKFTLENGKLKDIDPVCEYIPQTVAKNIAKELLSQIPQVRKDTEIVQKQNGMYSFPAFTNENVRDTIPDIISFEEKEGNPYGLTVITDGFSGEKKTYRTYGKNGALEKIIDGFKDNPTNPRENYNGLLYVSSNGAQDVLRYIVNAQEHNPERLNPNQMAAFVDTLAFVDYMSDYVDANIDKDGKVNFDEKKLLELKEKYAKVANSSSMLHKVVMWTHPLGWAEHLFNGFSYDRNQNTTGHIMLNYNPNLTFFENDMNEKGNIEEATALRRFDANKQTYQGAFGFVDRGN